MTATASRRFIATLAIAAFVGFSGDVAAKPGHKPVEKVGVVFVVHGGMEYYSSLELFDSSIQMFSYDPHHFITKMVTWNPRFWGMLLSSPDSAREIGKYSFEYGRMKNGFDPFSSIVEQQVADLRKEFHHIGKRMKVEFEVEGASWIGTGRFLNWYPYPRYIYTSPTNPAIKMVYCGQSEPGATGPWPGCNPERYNVDGPFERLANKGVSRIVMVDLAVGGMRFWKPFNVYTMGKRALADWGAAHGGVTIPLSWVNDPNDLMVRSYPTAPANWTRSLGVPLVDPKVPYEGNPNPIAKSELLARVNADAIAAAFNPDVPLSETGIIILNHATDEENEHFDPKINDTLVQNELVKAELLRRYPELKPENFFGGFMGLAVLNPENGLIEPRRELRGETNGESYLYETAKEMPPAPWGNRYFESLEILKNRGVKHMALGFTQISAESVLNLMELTNQVAKEVGYKTWRPHGAELELLVPEGPFADYWGIWVNKMCGAEPCCFVMGGCSDGRVYPPARQAPLTKVLPVTDPSLAFDVSEYGQLGYDPAVGPPNPAQPVQNQYRGTWTFFRPPNNDHRLIRMMALEVEKFLGGHNCGHHGDEE